MYKLFLAYGGDWIESQRTFERPEDVLKAQTDVVTAALSNGWNVGTRIEKVIAETAVVESTAVTRLPSRTTETRGAM